MQTRLQSLLESCVQVGFGLFIAMIAQAIVFPLYGIYQTFNENLQIALIFTAISIIRSYIFRRLFNKWVHK